jgi:hypothetical protein
MSTRGCGGARRVQMGKPRARNNITFKSGFESKEQVEKLDMFRHVPGAKACMGLFKHVHTEDGTCIHCFEVCTGLTVPQPRPVLQMSVLGHYQATHTQPPTSMQ